MRRSSSRSFNMRIVGHSANEKSNHHHPTVQDTLLSNEKVFQKVTRDRLLGEKNNRVEYMDGSVNLNQNAPQESSPNTHVQKKYDSISSIYDFGKERRTTEIVSNNDFKSYAQKEFYRQKKRLQNSTETFPLVNLDADPSHFLVDKGKHDKIRSMSDNKKELAEQENMDDCVLDSFPPVSHSLDQDVIHDYKLSNGKVYTTLKLKQDNRKNAEPCGKSAEVMVQKHHTLRGDKQTSILEEPLQSRVPLDGCRRNEEEEKSKTNELIMKTFTGDVSYKSRPSSRRAMSVDLAIARHQSKSNNFRLAKESGKDICVCGASAFWERERIAVTTERVRLKQKSEVLRSETVYLRETRNRLHSRLLDLENFETDIKSRSELLMAKEAAAEAESERLMRSQAEIKASREEATRLLEEVTLKERNVEVDRRKHEKEIFSLREQENFITSECRRLRDLASRLEKKKQEFTTVEDSLQEAKKQLKNIRDELQAKKNALDKQNQELLDVAYNLSEERKVLEQREKTLQAEISNIDRCTEDIREKEKILCEKEKRIAQEREKLYEEREFHEQMLVKIQTEKESLDAEREEFLKQRNKEKEVWFEGVAEEKRKLEEMTNALQDERNFYERQSKELQAFQQELLKKQNQMNEHLKVLCEKEESFKQIEEMNRKETQELNEMRLKIEKSQSALNISQKNLKEQQLKTTTQLEILGKEREQIANEMKAIQQNKIVLETKMKELDEKEARITQRESVLLSKEARSQWHQDIMKDMNDMKDRYELELQDLELEKRSFAELKADVLAEQERASVALRLREQSLAALEASIRTKHAEILRREKLTSLRGNTDTFLTSSPLRHTCKTSMVSHRHTILRPESTNHRSYDAYVTTTSQTSLREGSQYKNVTNHHSSSATTENFPSSQSLHQEKIGVCTEKITKNSESSTNELEKSSLHDASRFLQRSGLSSCSAATLLESPAFLIHENVTAHEKTSNTTTKNNSATFSYQKPTKLSSYPTFQTSLQEPKTPSLLGRLPQQTTPSTTLGNKDHFQANNTTASDPLDPTTLASPLKMSDEYFHQNQNVYINKLDVSTNSVAESPLLTI